MPQTPEDKVRLTYLNAEGGEVLAGEIPNTPSEIDADFLGILLQRAYDAGRLYQQGVDQRDVEDLLTKIRFRITSRGDRR